MSELRQGLAPNGYSRDSSGRYLKSLGVSGRDHEQEAPCPFDEDCAEESRD